MRLKIPNYAFELVGTTIPAIVGMLAIFFPTYFGWLGANLNHAIIAILVIAFIHALLFIFSEIFENNIFLVISRYFYAVFFVYIIFLTGGVNSSLIFLLFFPTVYTSLYLDKTTSRNISFVVWVLFTCLAFFLPKDNLTVDLIKHLIQSILVGLLLYLIHRLVTEATHHKTETVESNKRLSELVQVDRIKSDFLSVAQHQLRTPLSGVKWALEMLRADPAMPSDSISLIDAGLERVKDSLGIINVMLRTIEAEGGTLILKPEPVDIVGIIQTIIAELNFVVVKKGIKLSFISPQGLLLNADRDKIKAALINIIDNALKYSPKGRVIITLVDSQASATIMVEDNGIGIATDDLPYIFDRLHRGKNAVQVEPDESGVGLYTAKKVIELHGGTVSLESVLNKGTKVTVVLPKS